ncbi:MAG: NUDIX domain-containing protein [Flavobacteriales bacterium]|nr:NUDIX domain-containing protein [Flavobacteriales bacterium]
MYKVFIDNLPKKFEFKTEKELLTEFSDHQFIEAAGGIVQRKKSFLFIKRNGLWDIPKGKLEKGESPELGGIREIEEECGVMAPQIIKHLIDTWHTYEYKGKKVLKKTYWYWLSDSGEGKLVPQTEEGITHVEFLEESNFAKVRANTYLSIEEVMDELQKRLAKK